MSAMPDDSAFENDGLDTWTTSDSAPPEWSQCQPGGSAHSRDVTCSYCGGSGGSALTDSFLIPGRAGKPLVHCLNGGMHLHGVTIMPLGEERLRPTLRREIDNAWVRLKWKLRPYAKRGAVLAVPGVLLGIRYLAARRWRRGVDR